MLVWGSVGPRKADGSLERVPGEAGDELCLVDGQSEATINGTRMPLMSPCLSTNLKT
jgi:hypothetical protein